MLPTATEVCEPTTATASSAIPDDARTYSSGGDEGAPLEVAGSGEDVDEAGLPVVGVDGCPVVPFGLAVELGAGVGAGVIDGGIFGITTCSRRMS